MILNFECHSYFQTLQFPEDTRVIFALICDKFLTNEKARARYLVISYRPITLRAPAGVRERRKAVRSSIKFQGL